MTVGRQAPVGARAAPAGAWRTATVRSVSHPVADAVLLRLDIADRIDHLPGQHYVVRLRADDGYTAQRSYSVSSDPADPLVELFVERLPDGEVSGFLADVVAPGDSLEVRGPIGGWFVWDATSPALALGGGSGVVPFVAMLRHAIRVGRTDLLHLIVSARTFATLPYGTELRDAGALIVITREAYGDRPKGRLRADEITGAAEMAGLVGHADGGIPTGRAGLSGGAEIGSGTEVSAATAFAATAFVCGSAAFAEAGSRLLVDVGVPAASVRVERFGPSA